MPSGAQKGSTDRLEVVEEKNGRWGGMGRLVN
jgi:hypothetical protein